ncbi:retrotransposon protein, putative, ty1-copia subclass [Tanacetum coccineum]
MKSCGIVSQLTLPYTPQHNGVFERMNQTLLEMVRSMMNSTTLRKFFWGYPLESNARILNMVPNKKVYKTSYEIWNGKALNPSYLKPWIRRIGILDTAYFGKVRPGYIVSACRIHRIFVKLGTGYAVSACRLWRIGLLCSWYLCEASGSDVGLELLQELDTQPSDDTSEQYDKVEPNEVEPHSVKVPIRRSERISQAPDRYGFYVDAKEHELGDLNEPPNYKVAFSDPKSDKWLDVMNAEMQSMRDNQVKCLVDLPPNGRTVGNIRAILILLAIAALYDYEIWKMDVKTAFLNGHLRKPEIELKVTCYTDASFQTDKDDTKSQLGYVFALNGGAVVTLVLLRDLNVLI